MGRKRHKRRRKAVLGQGMLIGMTAAAVVAIAILAAFLWKREPKAEPAGNENSQEGLGQTGESMQESTVSSEAGDADIFGSKEAVESSEAAEGGEEGTPKREAAANMAAEVGSMEDLEDPQASTNAGGEAAGGAIVDVGSVALAEGENAQATLGIDVSKYQGTIDWAAVKNAGVEFAMIRVGYRTKVGGMLYEDPAARYNLQEATKNGIKAGAYFFSSAVDAQEAREEADWVASFVAKYKITYPVAYNCEDFQSPDSRQHHLTREERTQVACVFLDQIASYGYTPMFYASRNEMEGSAQWDMAKVSGKYKVWVSQYPENPFPDTPSSTYSGVHAMWQYTSQGQVAGVKGQVDVNVAYFGYDQEAAAKDAAPAEVVEANPEIGIRFTEVDETVTAKQETNLRNLPTTEGSSVVVLLKNGENVQRTGIGSNGWDRLVYNGQKVYAVHSFLTTDLTASLVGGADASGQNGQETPDSEGEGNVAQNSSQGMDKVGGMTFQAVSEAVTARDTVNLRDFPSTETGNVVGTLRYGEAVVRTGISGSMDTGWSRLSVNGQTVYASSRLLATSMDYKEQEKITDENPEAGMHFVAAAGTVMAKDGQTNLRTLPTTNEPSVVVATLTADMTAQRIGIDKDKGWTKLTYNGQTVYAVTNYLTVLE